MALSVIKNTNQETVVKVTGVGSETINLATTILAGTQALDGATQTVNIVGFEYVGLPLSTITVVRNSVTVFSAAADGHEVLDMSHGWSENTENTSNITVTIAAANAQCYLTLRKVSGYATKVELATFGAHDNPAVVGS